MSEQRINYSKEARQYEKAMSLKKNGDSEGAAKLFNKQAMLLKKSGRHIEAARLLHEQAMILQMAGDLKGAAKLLINACNPPTWDRLTYRELFKVLRELNSADMKNAHYQNVVDRALDMIRFDEEMIEEMLVYWGKNQHRELPKDYFDKDRNFNIRDAKILLKAARSSEDIININRAESLTNKFISQGCSFTAVDKPLAKQCEEINIRLIELKTPIAKTPELSVYAHYVNNGYVGAYCEGVAILSIIMALSLDVLKKYNQFGKEYATRSLPSQLDMIINPMASLIKIGNPQEVQEEIYEAIQSINKRDFLINYKEIIDKEIIDDANPGLTIEFASLFIDAVSRLELENITRKIWSSPFTYSVGWPDLTLVKEGKIVFAEVKTTDTLLASQLKTIPAMRKLINAEFIVVRLSVDAKKKKVND